MTRYRTLRDFPVEEYLSPGATMCAGCGAMLVLRAFHKVLGPDVVFVNAAGCLTLLQVYPYTPNKSSWMYTAFASAPAGAQGIRDALDILIEKGRVNSIEDLKVVVVTGDGAAYDIGLQSTSGAIERGLDFYYLVYDNEAYGNTGFQKSGATPYGSATATTPPTERNPTGYTGAKKDLFEIWRSHKPPYIATVAPSHMVDMLRKIETASQFKGPKLFIAFSSCPTGWGFDPSLSVRISRLAVECGVWPLKESVYGKVRHTYIPTVLKPVEEYLRHQNRFRHLFTPRKQEQAIASIQEQVNNYWLEAAQNEGFRITVAKPVTITPP
ncbi:pyruvate ferredoxin oxidoreductase, beta subunit [Candidatus Caldarchaeum subterraneum]|uniref:Pyruvate ferredoxin oxidoreductase, beta subunit n=1 Tax=Caldiarchaeum subterraneum TaxID=311458 RepID=E6N484_CALS0|nr:pyruvate ferredoxin oxidoreductase, beta subunit [Candidatus Caldarchaeum subterraneum]BAJ49932.1 pyruvate ferredoxin oxidoreductase, beta subunit [Candidatus Caldarchaeum subterraneum]